MSSIQKNVIYKKAEFQKESNKTLQDLLEKAFKSIPLAYNRMQKFDPDEGTLKGINHHISLPPMVCGNLVIFTPGQNKWSLFRNSKATEFDMAQIAPPKIDGKQADFLDSIFYFLCYGNHLVLVQSLSLRAKQFEKYLGWLLGQELGALKSTGGLMLADLPPAAQRSDLKIERVRSIRVGGPFSTGISSSLKGTDQPGSVEFRPIPQALIQPLLPKLFSKDNQLIKGIEENKMEAYLTIKYKGRNSPKGQEAMDQIARSCRNLDSDEYSVDLAGGRRITGDQLKLSQKINVRKAGTSVDQIDLFDKMHNWLMDNIKSGVIPT